MNYGFLDNPILHVTEEFIYVTLIHLKEGDMFAEEISIYKNGFLKYV